MKKVGASLGVTAAALLLAAGCASHETHTASTTTTLPTASGEKVVVTNPSASPAVVSGQVHHTLTGTVSDVDRKNGKVKLRTADGKVEFRLPPLAAASVHEGDQATVDVQIQPAAR